MSEEKKTIWDELTNGFNRVTWSFGDGDVGMDPQTQARFLHTMVQHIAPVLQEKYGVTPVRGQMRLDAAGGNVLFDVDVLKRPPAPASPKPG